MDGRPENRPDQNVLAGIIAGCSLIGFMCGVAGCFVEMCLELDTESHPRKALLLIPPDWGTAIMQALVLGGLAGGLVVGLVLGRRYSRRCRGQSH
jgi:hypothetical protein